MIIKNNINNIIVFPLFVIHAGKLHHQVITGVFVIILAIAAGAVLARFTIIPTCMKPVINLLSSLLLCNTYNY